MFIYNLHINSKSHILRHNLLFTVHIFRKTKVIETIVTVVYKQGHLVLGFQHTWVKFVLSLVFPRDPYLCIYIWVFFFTTSEFITS